MIINIQSLHNLDKVKSFCLKKNNYRTNLQNPWIKKIGDVTYLIASDQIALIIAPFKEFDDEQIEDGKNYAVKHVTKVRKGDFICEFEETDEQYVNVESAFGKELNEPISIESLIHPTYLSNLAKITREAYTLAQWAPGNRVPVVATCKISGIKLFMSSKVA